MQIFVDVAVVNALALWCIAEEGEQKYQNVFRELTFPPWTKKIINLLLRPYSSLRCF